MSDSQMSLQALPMTLTQDAKIQLLLFVDQRSTSWEQMRLIRQHLEHVAEHVSLDIVDVSKQPYLAEHFKLIATPTLLKLYPEPRQMLAGSDLVVQLERCWASWQRSLKSEQEEAKNISRLHTPAETLGCGIISSELFELSDQVFQLQKEKTTLEEQLSFKDRLISILAHDLRNPLTAISIALETLETLTRRHSAQGLAERSEIVEQIIHHARTQSRQIDNMVKDILDASHSSSNQLPIYPERLDLQVLFDEVLQQQQKHLQRKNHTIYTDIPNDLPFAYADKSRIQQVLNNLIDNAIKYTNDGGEIQIAILHRTSQKLQISIKDNGLGIPKEDQNHIFEDRFRLQRDYQTEGYGLGLALCQRVIRAHYGRIWVDSEVGCGTTFHFTLPVYRGVTSFELP